MKRMPLTLMLILPLLALAGPGAHGPGGEHLDAPAPATGRAALPRLEAATEAFELVATLHASELSILVDRFASNEPVLNARLEVASGALKALAKFHADHGDYAVDDPALLKLLQKPGSHALVFTLVAGEESDLLDGSLVVGAEPAVADNHDGHGHGPSKLWALPVLLALPLAGWAWRRRTLKGAAL
jgi:hypothetical protein